MKFFVILAFTLGALAETHTVHFNNRCGSGTPMLIQGPNVLSRGGDYTANGPLNSAIAYLNNGRCGFNGEGCTLVELTLKAPNPGQPGSGSSADISLIPPHSFSNAAGFQYTNGCNTGATCNDPNCPQAFRQPGDTHVQVACQAPNAGLIINFC